ncbi:MAG: serine hydrolase domain-containing protein [Acidimicrobiia bacterium]
MRLRAAPVGLALLALLVASCTEAGPAATTTTTTTTASTTTAPASTTTQAPECGLIPESARAAARREVDEGRSVGIVIGVVSPCGREFFGYGTTEAGGGAPVDEDTVFEIGSTGKAFTGVLLADMVQHGEVSLGDPIEEYLPDDVAAPTFEGHSITLEDLATHTSGLPTMPYNFAPADEFRPYVDYTVAQLGAAVSRVELTEEPGTVYEYSNLAFGLLGYLLSRHSGEDYEQLVETVIAGPLGMPDTAATLTPGMEERLATGYRDGRRMPLWENPTLAGAGDLRSTARDMVTFLAANVGLADTPLAPAMEASHARRFLIGPSLSTGLGWHIRTEDGPEIVEQHGATGGYWCFAGLVEDTQTGVVVLANTFNDVDQIGLDILRGES